MDASSEVESAVLRLICDEHGEDAVLEPGAGGNATPFPRPKEWVVGISAAADVHRTTESLLRDWVHAARGDGLDRARIAEAMDQPHDSPRTAADAAFTWAAPEPHWPGDELVTTWRCTRCGEWIRDHGPRDLGYDAIEDGHAVTCDRRDAENDSTLLP